MNDEWSSDPSLKALETQLALARPELPEGEAGELLYRCGFAAGKRSAARAARRWTQAGAASLVLAVATCLAIIGPPAPWQERQPGDVGHAPASPSPAVKVASNASFDAWQSRPNVALHYETMLAKFEQLDESSRAHSVGQLLLSAGNHSPR